MKNDKNYLISNILLLLELLALGVITTLIINIYLNIIKDSPLGLLVFITRW